MTLHLSSMEKHSPNILAVSSNLNTTTMRASWVQITCLHPLSPAVFISHCHNLYVLLYVLVPAGYGFVDFDSPASAQKAVTALKAGGVQAQMAKVRTPLEMSIFGGFISYSMVSALFKLFVRVTISANEKKTFQTFWHWLSTKFMDELLITN